MSPLIFFVSANFITADRHWYNDAKMCTASLSWYFALLLLWVPSHVVSWHSRGWNSLEVMSVGGASCPLWSSVAWATGHINRIPGWKGSHKIGCPSFAHMRNVRSLGMCHPSGDAFDQPVQNSAVGVTVLQSFRDLDWKLENTPLLRRSLLRASTIKTTLRGLWCIMFPVFWWRTNTL